MLKRRAFLQSAALAAAGAIWSTASGRAGAAETPGFRYAICNETFADWSQERIFAFAAECGYQGVEIAPFTLAQYVTDIPAARRAELCRQAKEAGVEIVGLHWLLAKTEGLYLTSPDAAVRQKTTEYLKELARFCADLGAKTMIFGSPKQRNVLPGVSRDEAMRYAAEVFQGVVPTLRDAGVRIGLEPLAPAETNFMANAAEAVELARRIDAPEVKIILDCKAMAGGETVSIPETVRKYRDWFIHFHANDPNLQGPGFGQLDFVPIFAALRDVHYAGWVSVEVFDYTPGAERLGRESIAYMKKAAANP